MSANNPIFKGDDTGAFGNKFITITVKNPFLYPISKLEFVVNGGCCIAPKVFTDENNFQTTEIELVVNFSGEETSKLNATNTGNLVAYDMQNQQSTCVQTLTFTAKNGVLCKCPN
jgi:hypothetical protein